MAGENDDLAFLRKFDQSTHGAAAAIDIEIHKNIVGKHGKACTHLLHAVETGDAQRTKAAAAPTRDLWRPPHARRRIRPPARLPMRHRS